MTRGPASSGLTVRLRQAHPVALDVAFECGAGELLALVGPSGSGKTTVLRCIAGLATPSEGEVTCNGGRPGSTCAPAPPPRRSSAGVGLVFQHYALFPHLDALANVASAMSHQPRGERTALALALLARVNMDGLEARRPSELSGRSAPAGWRSHGALARDPRALLLDEPFSAVESAHSEAAPAGARPASPRDLHSDGAGHPRPRRGPAPRRPHQRPAPWTDAADGEGAGSPAPARQRARGASAGPAERLRRRRLAARSTRGQDLDRVGRHRESSARSPPGSRRASGSTGWCRSRMFVMHRRERPLAGRERENPVRGVARDVVILGVATRPRHPRRPRHRRAAHLARCPRTSRRETASRQVRRTVAVSLLADGIHLMPASGRRELIRVTARMKLPRQEALHDAGDHQQRGLGARRLRGMNLLRALFSHLIAAP